VPAPEIRQTRGGDRASSGPMAARLLWLQEPLVKVRGSAHQSITKAL